MTIRRRWDGFKSLNCRTTSTLVVVDTNSDFLWRWNSIGTHWLSLCTFAGSIYRRISIQTTTCRRGDGIHPVGFAVSACSGRPTLLGARKLHETIWFHLTVCKYKYGSDWKCGKWQCSVVGTDFESLNILTASTLDGIDTNSHFSWSVISRGTHFISLYTVGKFAHCRNSTETTICRRRDGSSLHQGTQRPALDHSPGSSSVKPIIPLIAMHSFCILVCSTLLCGVPQKMCNDVISKQQVSTLGEHGDKSRLNTRTEKNYV